MQCILVKSDEFENSSPLIYYVAARSLWSLHSNYIQSDIPSTDCSRAMVDESILYDNDVMEQFVFLLLSQAIFF